MNDSQTSTTQPVADQPQGPAAGTSRHWPSTMQISIVVAILAGGVLLTANTSDVAKVSEPGVKLYADGTPFLIDHAGDWAGGEKQGLSKEEQDLLPQDTEGSRRLFKNNNGDQLYCSVILAGRDVASIHRPELCLPGQGWAINEHMETIPVADAPGGALTVMRMNGTRSVPLRNGRVLQSRSVFLYWFVGKDRLTASHWQRMYWSAKDRILHNTNHRWAYILIDVPVKDDTTEGGTATSEEYAMKKAVDFVQSIYSTLVEK